MFSFEYKKMFKNRLSKIFILLIILIPFIDLFLVSKMVYHEFFASSFSTLEKMDSKDVLNPAVASILSSSAQGHVSIMLLIWLVPMHLLIINSDSYVNERNIGYTNAVHSRVSTIYFVKNKIKFAFIWVFSLFLVTFLINFLFSNIIFNGGLSFKGLEMTQYSGGQAQNTGLLYFNIEHPVISYLMFVILSSFVIAIYNVYIVSLSFVVKNKITLYILSLIPWIFMFLTPYNLPNIMQPFTEYGWDYLVITLLLFLSIFISISLIIIRKFINYDKI